MSKYPIDMGTVAYGIAPLRDVAVYYGCRPLDTTPEPVRPWYPALPTFPPPDVPGVVIDIKPTDPCNNGPSAIEIMEQRLTELEAKAQELIRRRDEVEAELRRVDLETTPLREAIKAYRAAEKEQGK